MLTIKVVTERLQGGRVERTLELATTRAQLLDTLRFAAEDAAGYRAALQAIANAPEQASAIARDALGIADGEAA